MTKSNIKELLKPWIAELPDYFIQGMKLDSRKIVSGDAFLAVNGHSTDGRQYIKQAIEQGASVIIVETDAIHQHGQFEIIDDVLFIYFQSLSQQLSAISGRFYQNSENNLTLIGVTGTNGKTTITHLMAQWATLLQQKSAVLGTIGNGVLGQLHASENTTGSALDIQQALYTFAQEQIKLVAMEVSSHGIEQNRVRAIPFAAAVFTNLTQDHLDYHGNMENYEITKKQLFITHDVKKMIINIDDKVGRQWIKEFPDAIAVTLKDHVQADWQGLWLSAIKIDYSHKGTLIQFNSSWGKGELRSRLLGEFNVSNLLLALASFLALGYSLEQLLATVHRLRPIEGRMEIFKVENRPIVVVDYAHTPDVIEKALTASRQHCKGDVWCIFGCGGERDRKKRPLMASIAEQYADHVIVTDDNPRNENAKNIITDIMDGFLNPIAVTVIHNRIDAIQYAIRNANNDDIILLAGKGHENYQIIGDRKIHYSDRLTVQSLLGVIA